MDATPLFTELDLPRDLEVALVTFTPAETAIELWSGSLQRTWRVRFRGATELRVLDESDLLEFWPACSSPRGRVFRVQSGGWFDQEAARPGFVQPHLRDPKAEYFVGGRVSCVSVLGFEPPSIQEVPRPVSTRPAD